MAQVELRTIPLEDVLVEDRFREEFGDIDALALSLQKEGIIQPLAVAALPNGKYRLLAGGRRVKACEKAGITEIPVRIYAEGLSDLEMKSIELMENVCRKDMTWQEATNLRARIHELQEQIHGKKVSTSPDASGVSQRDTANLLGISTGALSEDIKMAEAMKVFPQLTQAKNRSDAGKMLKKLQEELVRGELVKRLQSKNANTPLEIIQNKLTSNYIVGDFFDMVAKVPNNSIDLIEADPIFGISLDEQKKLKDAGLDMKNYHEVAADQYLPFLDRLCVECYRVMAENSWIIFWFGAEPWFEFVYQALRRAGFQGSRLVGIWHKTNFSGQTMQPGLYLGNCYETFFYMRKGSPSISRQGRSNVFSFKPVAARGKVHPTEKPIELYQEILQTFGWEGSRLMIPFLGSGNCMLAAANLSMDAFGTDLSQENKDAYILKVMEARPGTYRSYAEVQ